MEKTNKKLEVCKHYPFVVVGCIIEKNNKIALVKQNNIDNGEWNQPAGWLEKGENPIDGAQREAEEETGFKIKITGFLGIYNSVKKNKEIRDLGIAIKNLHPVKLIFIAKLVKEGKLKNSKEIAEVKWFNKEEVLAMNDELRDPDIKDEIQDYFAGVCYSLDIIRYRNI